jgi:hypothetical protein
MTKMMKSKNTIWFVFSVICSVSLYRANFGSVKHADDQKQKTIIFFVCGVIN